MYVKIQFLANSAVARVFVVAVLFVCLFALFMHMVRIRAPNRLLIHNVPFSLSRSPALKLTVV